MLGMVPFPAHNSLAELQLGCPDQAMVASSLNHVGLEKDFLHKYFIALLWPLLFLSLYWPCSQSESLANYAY